jgi:hypothetical protein
MESGPLSNSRLSSSTNPDLHLVTLATPDGQLAQRSATTTGQKTILATLALPEPPRFLDVTVPTAD